MLFTTDKQTLDDLNIFGRHGGNSVFAIFNRTRTRGGAAVLEEMFRYPLSDVYAINRRSGIVQYFAAMRVDFPFQPAHFDAIEPYLANTDERTKLSGAEHSMGKRLSDLVGVDSERVVIYKGVQALVELLVGLRDLLTRVDWVEKEAIAVCLAETAFIPILEGGSKQKLSHATIAAYDLLFRFRHRGLIQELLRYCYYLDVYISVAKVALERTFFFPKALPADRHVVKLEGVYHLQVTGAVGNDIEITPDGNVLFLTGANMAGKSTFMKTVGIALYLAHMGFPVAATAMEFSVLDGIYTTINLPDNLGMGASHFYAEVLRVKKIAQELRMSRNLFVIFDELFRGTNVKDAYEATIAITEAFAGKRNSIFIISTHIIEAAEVLKQRCDNIRFIYLPTYMEGAVPRYTYKLEGGVTADRHGMVIVNNEGILDILKRGIPKGVKTKPV